MRTMYDSVNANAIPHDAEMVAGYVDGLYAWSQANWDRFPDAVKVRISAIGATDEAEVFDVEPGCIWPPERVVALVQRARSKGIDPTVYVNERNDWGPTKAAFDRAGVPHPHWWVANYNGVAAVPAGAVARQYAHPADPPGSEPSGPWEVAGHYDVSAVLDFWPGVDGSMEEDMTVEELLDKTPIAVRDANGGIVKNPDGSEKYVTVRTLFEWLGNEFNATRAVAAEPIDYDRLADEIAERVGEMDGVSAAEAKSIAVAAINNSRVRFQDSTADGGL